MGICYDFNLWSSEKSSTRTLTVRLQLLVEHNLNHVINWLLTAVGSCPLESWLKDSPVGLLFRYNVSGVSCD